MALRPNSTQIPAQRVPISDDVRTPVRFPREWYRFFDNLHTYSPLPTTFIPVFTSWSNVSTLTPGDCFATQMGTVVLVTGTFTLASATAGLTTFMLAPPVLENLALNAAAGMIVSASGAQTVGAVVRVGGSLAFRVTTSSTLADTYAFNVNYQIV